MAVLLLTGSSASLAQVTGKVIGTVTDAETRQPLVGGQVTITGTNLGNVTNDDGYYFINNVPVGVHRVTARYLGYRVTTHEQRILAGQTMTVDFSLVGEVIQAEGIVAVLDLDPLVARDNTISKARFTGDRVRALPSDDLSEVVTLGAGVYRDMSIGRDRGCWLGGFLCDLVIRGGRIGETAVFIDGAYITDFSDNVSRTFVGSFAVEEVDVITGGFNAEFGNAQSGIINIVTREGGSEHHGQVRFTTDEFSPEQSYGYNNLQASIGGPIIPGRLTFFGSFEVTGAEDFSPSVAGFNPAVTPAFTVEPDNSIVPVTINDPLVAVRPPRYLVRAHSGGSTEEILPGNRGDDTRLQAKLTTFLPGNARMTATYLFSRRQEETYDGSLMPDDQFRQEAWRERSYDIIAGYDQQIFQKGDRSLSLQVRGSFHESEYYYGVPASREAAAEYGARLPDCGAACEIDGDTFDDDFLNYRFGDVEFMFEDSMPGTVFPRSAGSYGLPDPVFGIPRLWLSAGISHSKLKNKERRYGIRVDLDSQLTRVHRAKVGVEWTWINHRRLQGGLVGTEGGNDYDVDPSIGAVYVQDRLDFGDLVIDVGLRWDHWSPNTRFPAIEEGGEIVYAPGLVPCEIVAFESDVCVEGGPTLEAPTRDELAPRLGVAHPITDRTQVRMSYGKFYQLPRLSQYFARHNTMGFGIGTKGNPNLDFVETTAFEAGITTLLSENVVLDVVGYNRDRRGAVRADLFQTDDFPEGIGGGRVFTNADNGNVKGIDVTFSKQFSDYWSTDLAWSLQWARGTTSTPLAWWENGFATVDPLNPGFLLPPPTQQNPEDFDRLHNINWQFNLRFPDNFKEGTVVGRILQNWGLYVVYNAQSGIPATRFSINWDRIEHIGASRLPWIHSGDIRITKGFTLGDGLDLSLFTLVQNFLNTENWIEVDRRTLRPDLGMRPNPLPRVPTEFQIEPDSGFPYALDNIVEEQDGIPIRSRIANQDLNGDGWVSENEAAAILREAYRCRYDDVPENYGAPRTIRFGAEIRF